MKAGDFAQLVAVCLIWAINVVLGRIVIADLGAPPLLFAALRFALVAALLVPWLRPMPRPMSRLAGAGVLMGAAHFGLLFIGLKTASPSSAAVVTQFGVPLTVVLSVVFLRERISLRRIAGIALAFAGVLTVVFEPQGFSFSGGLLAVLVSISALSVGSILLKRVERVSALRLQAWVSLVSVLPLAALSAVTEPGALSATLAIGWPIVAATVFSAVVVTIMGHTTYYRLLQAYNASVVSPLTLMMPLMTMALGVMFTGDRLDLQIIAGAACAMAGVLLIVLPAGKRAPHPLTDEA